MNGDIIEIKIFDKDHTKYFQIKGVLEDKKSIRHMNESLKAKGILFIFKNKEEEVDFF